MKSKVLITGGVGFIFSYVTEYFVTQGYEVVVIDNLSEGSHPEIINDTFKFYEENAGSTRAYEIILKENPEYIIHAAAYSDVDGSIKKPLKVINENCVATLNVFEAARQCLNLKKLVYVSTDEVFGECDHRKTEEDIIFPKNPYSASKAFGSLLRLAYDNTYQELFDKTAETRFCNVFGPRQDTRKVLPAIKEALETGNSFGLHNGGTGYREYLYVKNIPEAIELVMLNGNRTFNITLNDGFTVACLVDECERITGQKIQTHATERPGMDSKYQMDNTRIMELGWQPKYSFSQGIHEYLS